MLDDAITRQAGVLTRAQALAAGLTDEAIEARLRSGRWRRLHRGVYATSGGPASRLASLWAAVLYAGAGAMLSHRSAGELCGLVDEPAPVVHVTVPAGRRVRVVDGIVVHRSSLASPHPTRVPPQSRVEETVVDLVLECKSVDDAFTWIARACGRRLTTAQRLRRAFGARTRLRWREEIDAVLSDVADGCHSLLEHRYLRLVERAHRLPVGRRQVSRRVDGVGRYDDVRYDDYRVVVELDGRLSHEDAFRDMRRDNASNELGDRVLRYGWPDVAGSPCRVAAQAARVLHMNGWRGAPHPCRRSGCAISTTQI